VNREDHPAPKINAIVCLGGKNRGCYPMAIGKDEETKVIERELNRTDLFLPDHNSLSGNRLKAWREKLLSFPRTW
jgi:hypothetical protein